MMGDPKVGTEEKMLTYGNINTFILEVYAFERGESARQKIDPYDLKSRVIIPKQRKEEKVLSFR